MLQCIVVTPENKFYDQPADFVAMMLYDGEVGIAPGHTPLIGRLGYGEMRVRHGKQVERFYIEGGFLEVLDDVVSVLTHRAIPAAEIDEEVAGERLKAAQSQHAATPETIEQRARNIAQCRAQLHIAQQTH